MEVIIDADYTHAKRVCIDFEIKNISKYNDLYVQSDTLLLADVFNNFQNKDLILLIFFCLKISMESNLKKDQTKIRSIN